MGASTTEGTGPGSAEGPVRSINGILKVLKKETNEAAFSSDGDIIRTTITEGGGGGGGGTFLSLTDTPIAFTGAGSEILQVNPGATAVEFTNTPTISSFANAAHDHSNAANGGTIPAVSLNTTHRGLTNNPHSTSIANIGAWQGTPESTGGAQTKVIVIN